MFGQDNIASARATTRLDALEQPQTPSSERSSSKLADKASVRQSRDARTNMQAVYDSKRVGYKVAKRAFDIVLSGTALVVLSPVFLATAIAIVAEDGRPVFYSSWRPGKNMKPFPMHKFRSMHKHAEKRPQDLLSENEQSGAAFKIKDDPRITKVGRFIRKHSIDELPQLLNVLKGEMSIVGPRPIVAVKDLTDYETQRAIVQPGLTCYWQVGGRADIPWEEWVELDLDYIQDMSLATDARIIGKTFGVVLKGEGGY